MRVAKAMPAALALIVAAALGFPIAAPASAPLAKPAWSLQALAAPTHFKPGDVSGLDLYEVFLTNSGGEVSDQGKITITDTLPKGLGVKSVELNTARQPFNNFGSACNPETGGETTTVTCTIEEGALAGAKEPAKLFPGEQLRVAIHLTVPVCPGGVSVCPLVNVVEVQGGGAEPAGAESDNEINEEEKAPAGLQEFHSQLTGTDGRVVSGADSHPYQYTNSFAFNLDPAPPTSTLPYVPSGGDLKGVEVALPPGLIANPTAVERCSAQQFNTVRGTSVEGRAVAQNECPDGSAVGLANAEQLEGSGGVGGQVPIYELIPPTGMPAQFGFQPAIGLPVYIDTAVQEGPEGLSVRAFVPDITEAKRITAALLEFWGTPANSSHDRVRGQCAQAQASGPCPAGIAERPFFRLPSSCESALLSTFSFETWAQPPARASGSFGEPAPSGCAEPDFSPRIEAKPTTNVADSPSGLDFKLHLPQKENEDSEGLGEADLKDVSVTLPRGLAVNPAAADGRAACTPAQIGLLSAVGETPIRFDEEPAEAPAACPTASKVGKVEVDTPLLDHPIDGSVYLAAQENNPFKSLLALYIALEDPQSGIVIKLAGKVSPDPLTGQLSTTFTENPQVPFEDLKFDFFEGARAPLRTPPTCGSYETSAELTPWTAPEGASATRADSFPIGAGPEGPCPTGALAPKLSAGLANLSAGTYSPFHLRLSRADGSGEFAALDTTTPKGLAVKLAGVPYCPESGIAQATSRDHPGQGALEAASPSCPSASQVGTTTAGAGAGPTPFYTSGKVYLAGPYKGAPLSFVAIVPAVAGPFDLGVVTNRIALHINPETAQATAVSDSLPTILSGIPLDLRDIRVDLDRPNFALAPTSCDPKSVDATVFGPAGNSASVSNRFQLGDCGALGFKPGLSLRLKGGTKRGAHPAFTATLTYPKGKYANVASVQVALPHSEFLDTTHIRTICTRVQFAANSCPPGAIYGYAKATSPLLDKPLQGPVYLRSSTHPLPDLVIDLNGQVQVVLDGRVDSVHGGTRTTFEAAPDAPISKFTLEMRGGKKGLFQNSTDICRGTHRATATFTAQNGKTEDLRPPLKADCKATKHRRR